MPITLPLISVNGVLDAAISPLDRGFTYGDGLFETCRIHAGKISLWDYHLKRLVESAARLKIPLDLEQLQDYSKQLFDAAQVQAITAGVFKIIVTRGIGGRGYRMPDVISPTYCLGIFPAQPLSTDFYLNGADVRICEQRLSNNQSLAGLKHLNRLEHILARSEWQDEFAEGLLLDANNLVIEGTVSNLFIVKNNQLITPDLNSAGVAGIMRRVIIEQLAPVLTINVVVQNITLSLVQSADEIFLTNSVFGIWPVRSLAGVAYTQHRITRQLQTALEAYLNIESALVG